MPRFYLQRDGKIPTSVHPFVKQTAFPQDKHKPSLLQGKIIQDVQNIAMFRAVRANGSTEFMDRNFASQNPSTLVR